MKRMMEFLEFPYTEDEIYIMNWKGWWNFWSFPTLKMTYSVPSNPQLKVFAENMKMLLIHTLQSKGNLFWHRLSWPIKYRIPTISVTDYLWHEYYTKCYNILCACLYEFYVDGMHAWIYFYPFNFLLNLLFRCWVKFWTV